MSTTQVAKNPKQNAKAQDAAAPQGVDNAGLQAAANDAANEQAAKENAEFDAIILAAQALSKAMVETGTNVLFRLARAVGATVNKAGYPAFIEWHRFTTACAVRNVSYELSDRLFLAAKNAVGGEGSALAKATPDEVTKAKSKFVTSTSTANVGKASCRLAMRAPANWKTARE